MINSSSKSIFWAASNVINRIVLNQVARAKVSLKYMPGYWLNTWARRRTFLFLIVQFCHRSISDNKVYSSSSIVSSSYRTGGRFLFCRVRFRNSVPVWIWGFLFSKTVLDRLPFVLPNFLFISVTGTFYVSVLVFEWFTFIFRFCLCNKLMMKSSVVSWFILVPSDYFFFWWQNVSKVNETTISLWFVIWGWTIYFSFRKG